MPGFSIGGFNVGTDFSAVMTDNYGDIFPLDSIGLLMEMDTESMDKELEVTPISGGGVPLFQTIWAGVRGRMMFTRNSGNLESMIISLMQAYHTFGVIPSFTLAASILNRDSSINEYLYTGFQFSKPRLGNYRSEKEVDQQIEFKASLLTTTGAALPFLPALDAAA